MKKILPPLVAALLSGLLISVLFEPYNQLSALWFALVPLLLVIRHASLKVAFWTGILTGFITWSIQLFWLCALKDNGGPFVLVWVAWIVLPLYLSLYFGLFAAIACKFRHLLLGTTPSPCASLQRILCVALIEPAIWVTMEMLRSTFLTGFAWNPLGLGFASAPVFLQPAAIGGISLVSALVIALNGAVATIIERFWWAMHRQLPQTMKQKILFFLETAIPFIFMLVAFLWGTKRIQRYDACLKTEAKHIPVALLATDVPCVFELNSTYRNPFLFELATFAEHITFLQTVLPALQNTPIELLITPESAALLHDFNGKDGGNLIIRERILKCARKMNTPLLIGGLYRGEQTDGQIPYYNCAVLATTQGYDYQQVYGKRHLVPFGEYIFLDKVFPSLQQFVPGGISCTPGERSIIELPSGYKFGPLICFDDVDATLSRQSVLDGASFLVNISNDAWYTPSAQPKAHLQQAMIRCIETGVPMARTSNRGGISFIDAVGRARYFDGSPSDMKLLQFSELSNTYFMEKNMLINTLPLLSTPFAGAYLTYGEAVFVAPCVLLTFAFLAWCFLRYRKPKTILRTAAVFFVLFCAPLLTAKTTSLTLENFAERELLPISGMAIDDHNVSLAESTARAILSNLGITTEDRAKAEEVLIRADFQQKRWIEALKRIEDCAELPFERRIVFLMYGYCGQNDYASAVKLYDSVQLPYDTEWGIAALRIAILANLKLKNNLLAAERFKIVDESSATTETIRAANALAWNLAFPSPNARTALLKATEQVKSEQLFMECAQALPIVFKSESKQNALNVIQKRIQTTYAPTMKAKLLLIAAELSDTLVDKIAFAKQAEVIAHDVETKMEVYTFIGDTYLLNKANIEEGISYLQKAVTTNPSHASAPYIQLKIAETYAELNQVQDAIKAYTRYRESFSSPELYVRSQRGYARVLMRAERPQDALVALLDAADKTTNSEEEIEIRLEAAEAATIAQRPAKAIAIYRETLKLNPTNRQDIQLLLARTLEKNNEKDEAENVYYEICEKSNTSSENLLIAALRLGELYMENERFSQAISLYSKVIGTVSDEEAKAYLLLARGKLYYLTERYDQAKLDFEKIADIKKTDIQTEAQFFLVTTLYYLGEEEKARSLANNYIIVNPNHRRTPDVILWIAKNDFNNGLYDKAIEGFNTFIKSHPEDPRIATIYYFKARANFFAENYTETIETITTLVKEFPQASCLLEARYLQAKALIRLARFEEALNILSDVTRLALNTSWIGDAYGDFADCLRMTSTSDPKREQLAISAYRDAVIRLDEIEHDKALMYIFEIGRIYERQKNYTDALQQYSRIIYRILDNPELYTQTGIQIGIKAYINFEKIEKSAGNYERVNLLYNRIREADVPNFNP